MKPCGATARWLGKLAARQSPAGAHRTRPCFRFGRFSGPLALYNAPLQRLLNLERPHSPLATVVPLEHALE